MFTGKLSTLPGAEPRGVRRPFTLDSRRRGLQSGSQVYPQATLPCVSSEGSCSVTVGCPILRSCSGVCLKSGGGGPRGTFVGASQFLIWYPCAVSGMFMFVGYVPVQPARWGSSQGQCDWGKDL